MSTTASPKRAPSPRRPLRNGGQEPDRAQAQRLLHPHGEPEQLAELCASSRAKLASAGRLLHDEIGPRLAGAGILLSLARTDYPQAAGTLTEALNALDQAMDRVRALSQELNPTPVDRMGLENALTVLAEQMPMVEIDYRTSIRLPREIAALLYEMTYAAIAAAIGTGAERIRVAVSGARAVSVRVSDDGSPRGRAKALATPIALAEASGLTVTLTTGKSTIVSIAHANRRSTSR